MCKKQQLTIPFKEDMEMLIHLINEFAFNFPSFPFKDKQGQSRVLDKILSLIDAVGEEDRLYYSTILTLIFNFNKNTTHTEQQIVLQEILETLYPTVEKNDIMDLILNFYHGTENNNTN